MEYSTDVWYTNQDLVLKSNVYKNLEFGIQFFLVFRRLHKAIPHRSDCHRIICTTVLSLTYLHTNNKLHRKFHGRKWFTGSHSGNDYLWNSIENDIIIFFLVGRNHVLNKWPDWGWITSFRIWFRRFSFQKWPSSYP